ncbi:hypothetical protein ACFFJX_02435 [Pseudarcicella hirudinis]|uniref:hypothetical protein n=1 Tax=Pseudarcicella hirudinis TaxID=1079859 RepID=UPI0035F01DCC
MNTVKIRDFADFGCLYQGQKVASIDFTERCLPGKVSIWEFFLCIRRMRLELYARHSSSISHFFPVCEVFRANFQIIGEGCSIGTIPVISKLIDTYYIPDEFIADFGYKRNTDQLIGIYSDGNGRYRKTKFK